VVLVNIIESYCRVNHGETAASYSCCLYTAPVAWGLNGQQEAGNKKKLKRNDLQTDKAISIYLALKVSAKSREHKNN